MGFDVPILFLAYNRPSLTKITLERIMQINPLNLYVSLDGPNSEKYGDLENCNLVKQIVCKTVRKDCNLHLKINSSNTGCKYAVKNGIDWFFGMVEYGIILEDDCLPNLSFFDFCKVLLLKYRSDDCISHISGSNFQYGIWRGLRSYYFSKYTHIWGWATWKRAWKDYDIEMKNFESSSLFDGKTVQLPMNLFRDVYQGKIDTWDIQWFYTNILYGRMTIIPNINLVENLGFDKFATHTNGKHYSYMKYSKTGNLLFPLSHPFFYKVNFGADQLIAFKIFSNTFYNLFYKKIFIFSFFIDRVISKIKYKIFKGYLFRINNI